MKILIIGGEVRLAYDLYHEMSEVKYTIRFAPDTVLGLNFALTGKFDLIVLEWCPPKIDCMKIMRGLHERGNTTPVLVRAEGIPEGHRPRSGHLQVQN